MLRMESQKKIESGWNCDAREKKGDPRHAHKKSGSTLDFFVFVVKMKHAWINSIRPNPQTSAAISKSARRSARS